MVPFRKYCFSGVVGSFFRILQSVVLKDCLAHVSISNESALEERFLLGCFDRCEGCPIIYEFFKPADFSAVDGGGWAVIDELSVSSVQPDDRAVLEYASMKPSPSDDIAPGFCGKPAPLPQLTIERRPCGSKGSYMWSLDLFRRKSIPAKRSASLLSMHHESVKAM